MTTITFTADEMAFLTELMRSSLPITLTAAEIAAGLKAKILNAPVDPPSPQPAGVRG